MGFPYLSLMIFLPALGAGIIALMRQPRPIDVKRIALLFTFVPFIISLFLFSQYDRAGGIQFEELRTWIPAINAKYHLGVDGLSLPLVLLTTFLGVMAVLISWRIDLRCKEYFAWLLVLETGILGVFCSLDLLLFFLFWEIELIPMYMLIAIWGTGRREYSAIKFVVYTAFGGAFLLVGILVLYFATGTFSIVELSKMNLEEVKFILPISILYLLIFMAFWVKVPIFPFHTWLPDAHTDAPTAVSVILAGILLKMGGYAIIRLNLTLFPEQTLFFAPLFAGLAIVNVLYGAAVTLRQQDIKRLIAYSSISHMGYVVLGIYALTPLSVVGATLQMVSHGFITGLLFALAGLIMENSHERSLEKLGGLARQMPVTVAVFSVAAMGALGLPGTSGFIAEFTIFLGSFTSTAFELIRLYTILGVIGIVITAGYILWVVQRTFYGPPQEKFAKVHDATPLEMVYLFSFVFAIMAVGLYPALLIDVIKVGVFPLPGLLR